jgi:succinate-acetate transporter protein
VRALKFFAPAIIASAGANAFGAWLILWAMFTAMLAVGARTVNMPAFLAFVLLVAVYVILAIASLGGSAGWAGTVTKVGGWRWLTRSLPGTSASC